MSTKKLVIGGLLAAMVFVATYLGAPVGTGYIHAGDAVINVGAVLLGPVAALASGLGSLLADISKGYASYAIPTFIIKALDSLVVMFVFAVLTKAFEKRLSVALRFIIAATTGSLVMISGYFIADYFLYREGLILNLPFNVLQAVVGVALGAVLYLAISKTNMAKSL